MLVLACTMHAGSSQAAESIEAGISFLGESLARQLSANGVRRVAVLDFVNGSGGQTGFERCMTDLLGAELLKRGAPPISRYEVDGLLARQNLRNGTRLSGHQLSQVGGVDAFVLGLASDIGGIISLRVEIYSGRAPVTLGNGSMTDVPDSEIVVRLRQNAPCSIVGQAIVAAPPAPPAPQARRAPAPPLAPPPVAHTPQATGVFFFDHTEADVRYQAQACRTVGSKLICELRLTNQTTDRKFSLNPRSTSVFDDQGGQHALSRSKIANKSFAGGRWHEVTLIQGVPVRMLLEFDNVGAPAGVSALYLKVYQSPDIRVSAHTIVR